MVIHELGTRPARTCYQADELQGVSEMLLYEVLIRTRIREAEENARRQRQVRHLVAGQRWAWLARYAARRAERLRPLV
jgi:hypothetical protein